jgi:hypothetical protein
MVRRPTATTSWGVTTATVATVGTVDVVTDGSSMGVVSWWVTLRRGWKRPHLHLEIPKI